jgi:D-alanyl-D-alanine carboxypeptidase/D-alanyl-D-alanine-endopeptidase (penicillin-binding protein 4)
VRGTPGHGPDVLFPRPARPILAVVLLALLLAAFAAPSAGASLRTSLARALQVPGVQQTGALAVDLRNGGPVYARNPGLSLRPASNEKLTVAVATLDRLGPGFRTETVVLGEGRLELGVWQGNLVLKGYGDPTLTRTELGALVRQVRAAGVRQVTGRIEGDESFFDTKRVAPGWKPSFYKEESPPLSALVVDRAKVNGRTVDDPALAAAQAFRAALRSASVRVPNAAVKGVAASGATPLGRLISPTMARLVRSMDLRSDNFFAEMLVKQLGARKRGAGTTPAGMRVVWSELNERGVPLAGVQVVDGSGLSRYDRLTARAIAALLISAFSDPAISAPFVGSLPVAGISGTLRDRMERPPALGNVYAKTGTTTEASALSGYVKTRYVFSILQNGYPIAWWYARRGQDRFATILAGAAG